MRKTLAALAVAGLLTAGGTAVALAANADPGPLTVAPAATSITITDLDRTRSVANAASAYAVRLDGLPRRARPVLQVVSAPDGGFVQYEVASAGASPTTAFQQVPAASALPDPGITDLVAALSVRNRQFLYLGAVVPGSYQVRVFDDANRDLQFDDGDEAATPVLSIRVLDITNPNRSVNDWTPRVSYLPAALKYGTRPRTTVDFGGLSSVDARGRDRDGKPILGWNAVGRALQWQIVGAGYPLGSAPVTSATSWIPIDSYTSGTWYKVAPVKLKDVSLADYVRLRVRLDPAALTGATWSTPAVTRAVGY